MELALYHASGGFYEGGGRAGRGGADFLTSPEVGPLFGTVLAGAAASWWDTLGRPDPFLVVEAGAGTGTLALSMLRAGLLPAPTRYVVVERSATLRAVAADRLGDQAEVTNQLPAGPIDGVILANELLDNLPFRLLQRTGDTSAAQDRPDRSPFEGWAEVYVDENLAEVLLPASIPLAPEAAPGARIPVQEVAAAWVADAVGRLRRGRVVVVDYADTTASMAARPWTDWVRTYRDHARAGRPLDGLGTADITCEVAVDQLPPPTLDRSQADFLRAYGLDDLVTAARAEWQARAHVGDLQALKARSLVAEAADLTDQSGLGAFRVLEWEVPGRLDPHGRPAH